MVIITRVYRRYITVHLFCKIFKKYSPNAYWIRLIGQCIVEFSVIYANFFDIEDRIHICLEIVVWKF